MKKMLLIVALLSFTCVQAYAQEPEIIDGITVYPIKGPDMDTIVAHLVDDQTVSRYNADGKIVLEIVSEGKTGKGGLNTVYLYKWDKGIQEYAGTFNFYKMKKKWYTVNACSPELLKKAAELLSSKKSG